MSFVLSGLVTKLQNVPARTFADGNSAPAHWRAFVAGGEETYRVKLSDDYMSATQGVMPVPGEMIHAEVNVSAYRDRLAVTAVSPVAAPVPAPPKG